MRLKSLLKKIHPEISTQQWEKSLALGLIFIGNKKLGRLNELLSSEEELIIHHRALQKKLMPNPNLACKTIKETKDFIFLEKPAGIHSVAHDFFETQSVSNWLVSVSPEFEKIDPLECGLAHRLDKSTSGVMVAAKELSALHFLKKLFQEKQIEKIYTALVDRHVPIKLGIHRAFVLPSRSSTAKKVHLSKNPSDNKKTEIITEILQVNEEQESQRLTIRLITGHRHQIRSHLSFLGTPILGDILYGGKKAERIYLHSTSLKFTAISGEKIFVVSPPSF